MSGYTYEPFEIAKVNLKNKSSKFIQTQIRRGFDVTVVTNYFLAMESLDLGIFTKKIRLEPEEQKRFDNNKKLLVEFRKQIKNNSLKSNLSNFSLGFVLGGLISILRESEGNIDKYKEYIELSNKIRDIEKECETEEFLAKVWKKTVESVDEILSYLDMKSETFYPTLKAIFEEFKRSEDIETIFEEFKRSEDINNKAISIVIGVIKEHHDDREGFFLFSNIIEINPFLYKKFENLCKEHNLEILTIHKIVFGALRMYRHKIEDRDVLHLIDVFLNNPNYS